MTAIRSLWPLDRRAARFTPIQLANYIATLVNGGTRYQVHLLKSVKSHDFSEVLYEYEPVVLDTIEIEKANLDAVKEGMLALTTEGSVAKYFSGLDVQVGAKDRFGAAQRLLQFLQRSLCMLRPLR